MQSYVLASGDHESGVRIHLTSESDDLLENHKDLERAPGSPAPIMGYKLEIRIFSPRRFVEGRGEGDGWVFILVSFNLLLCSI